MKSLVHPDAMTLEELEAEALALEYEAQRQHWLADPVAWAHDRLGDTLWSGQQAILLSVRDHRRTAVRSCHEIGKSYIASVIVGWWLDTAPLGDAFVVTSAPTVSQVEAILWREIGRVHARGSLRGRLTTSEWKVTTPSGREELIAFGRKPSDFSPDAFQGIHALRVLYVFDEANGIPTPLWEAADSLIANKYSKALAIGNPDDPMSEFAQVCKPGSGWHVIGIGAFDSPNFTGEALPDRIRLQLIDREYVEEKRRRWAPMWYWTPDQTCVIPPASVDPEETNPLWQSKILGRFPKLADSGALIPLPWIQAAQLRTLVPGLPSKLGVDVGGGGDSSTIAHNRGGVVRILSEDHNPDTMHTCGTVVAALRATEAEVANVDVVGIGRGVVDRALEQGARVDGISVGEAADNAEEFVNRRAELWWHVRGLFEAGTLDLDPADDDLAGELTELRFKRTSTGKIQIESKDEARRRGVASPNRADALMLSCAHQKYVPTMATWGHR